MSDERPPTDGPDDERPTTPAGSPDAGGDKPRYPEYPNPEQPQERPAQQPQAPAPGGWPQAGPGHHGAPSGQPQQPGWGQGQPGQYGQPSQGQYGQPGQGQYGQPSYGQSQPPQGTSSHPYFSQGSGAQPYAAQRPPNHPSAVTSLILGLVSIIGTFTCFLPAIAGPFAWYLGAKAVKQIDAEPQRYGGRSEAMTGKITGIVGTVLLVLGIIGLIVFVIFVVIAAASSPDYYSE